MQTAVQCQRLTTTRANPEILSRTKSKPNSMININATNSTGWLISQYWYCYQ